MCLHENTSKIKISASQLISNMICINYDNNKKFWLLQFHSFHFISINAQTDYLSPGISLVYVEEVGQED